VIRFASPFALAAVPVFLAAAVWFARRAGRAYALRALTILIVLVALASPQIVTRRSRSDVYLIVDRSASVARTASASALHDAVLQVAASDPDRTYGVIEFATSASVVTPLGSPIQPPSPDPIDTSRTNLARAVELGISLLPREGAGQLVLVTDGRATDDLRDAIGAAQADAVPVSILPIGETIERDLALVAFHAPSEVPEGRPFSLEAEIDAARPGHATLALYRDGSLLLTNEVELGAGRTRVTFTDTAAAAASRTYELVVKGENDPVVENDRLSLLVRTTTRPPVLLVDRAETSIIPSLLDAAGVAFATADEIPTLRTLSEYSQLILSGVPLDSLTLRETDDIERFTRHLGGGVLLVQGEAEVRGFAASPIEDLLPVAFSVPEKEQEPSLAIVYLLDRSSSMRALTGGVAKIRILRNAAAASITLLPGDTRVGVVAFDDVHQWMIPIAPVGEGASVYAALRKVRAEGGTDLYYPLDDALTRLQDVEARSKHLILITDGKTTHEERDYPGLLDRLSEHPEITLSAIALGETPNLALLGSLVDAGRGALYHVTDFLKLPQLTMQVTQRLSRSRFVTGTVDVTGIATDPLGGTPPIGGYVLTFPRASSQTGLWAGSDPLFSTWKVGLGTVSVLNTDLAGTWTASWAAWPRASALFETLLRTTAPVATTRSGLTTMVTVSSEDVAVTVDAREPDGQLAEFLALKAHVLPSDRVLDVPQVGPGIYYRSFPAPTEGGYALQITDLTRGRAASASFSIPYSPEYRATGIDREALDRIVSATGGVILEDGASLPALRAAEAGTQRPIARPLLLAALALFLLDLTVRKLPRRRAMVGSSRAAE